MRFLLPLPTQPEQHADQEGGREGTSHPSIAQATGRPLGGLDGYVWARRRRRRRRKKKRESEELESLRVRATSSETEVWQTMDALIYGRFCQAGERTISSRTIWFNSKGPLETIHVKHWQEKKKRKAVKKKERKGRNFALFKTHVRNWNRKGTLRFCSTPNFCHTDLQISHHP